MQKKVTLRVSKIVTEETDFIINYPTDQLFDQVIQQLAKQPDCLHVTMEDELSTASAMITNHRELSEVTCIQGSLGPEPTVYIYDAKTGKEYFNNGQNN